ncbi:reticulon-like protein B17 isoform X1 [Solanum dulcamara]|uniref:reticulon-like protein B17 isoform X1 n=1 Tax=Solanum dulcamara TaxID=45834 RepID=UPI0024859141|nr:reticulon-like protein B17 isoform X1 [Solanum dulcamara]
MDTTPPQSHRSETRSRTKSASRLSRIRRYDEESESVTPRVSLEIVPSPRIEVSPYDNGLPLRELLLLSPSPLRRSKTRLSDKLELADDGVEPNGVRRRRRSRNSAIGASPRNNRRSRRRLEQEMREERDLGLVEEVVKPRKKRNNGKSKKDKLSLVPSNSTKGDECDFINRIEILLSDLVMWRDVARSSLWFGLGSLCFLSSCFAKGVTFSIFSIVSQLGLLFLVVSFFSHSIRQRDGREVKRQFQLTEDDILRMGRLILPAANLAISKTRELFSGEPAMTLKLVPVLIIGAEYGHMITVWRLCYLGFFISFTAPKLYSSYSYQIYSKAINMKYLLLETWGACSHKKMIAASLLTAFWNLTTVRTRIFTAFICLVIFRYCKQHEEAKVDEEMVEVEEDQQQALVVLEPVKNGA